MPRFHARSRTRLGDFLLHALHAGAGPPVVLLHGLAGSHRWWRHTVPALAPHFRVSIPELIGFGASKPVPHQPTVAAMAALVAEWLDSIGVERAHIVGHSMGAQIAIHFAAGWHDRVERLVLASPAGVPRELGPAALARLAAELAPPWGWGDLLFLPTLARDTLRAGPRVMWNATRFLLDDDVRPLLPAIRAHTLVIHGSLDPLIPQAHARLVAKCIPHGRLKIIPRAAHNPMLDRPRQFNDVTLGFLRGVDDAGAHDRDAGPGGPVGDDRNGPDGD